MNPSSIYQLPTLKLAKRLLGATLTTTIKGKETSGRIVEVEAYHGDTDPACHCFYWRTPRNEVMFWNPGYCYVYFIYGMHYCFNIVSEARDTGAAVLIRAVEPLAGIELMQQRRRSKKEKELTNGPAKLCQALGIDKRFLGEHLLDSKLISITPQKPLATSQIVETTRIGISQGKDLPWRFYDSKSSWISKR